MRLVEKKIFLSRKKIAENIEQEQALTGILVPVETETKKQRKAKRYHSFRACMLRGLLVFLGTMGTIGCYTTCFPMEYNWFLVGAVLLLISLFTSFFYYNAMLFNMGYCLLLCAFGYSVYRLGAYAKSGFGAILNITSDIIDQKYLLPAVRYFSEGMGNRYTTITIILIIAGAFLAILLNSAISGTMSFVKVFLLTFPLIAIGLFFDRTPSLSPVLMVCICYLAVVLIKKNYEGFSMGILAAAVSALVLLLLAVLVPQHYFVTPPQWNQFKNAADESVRNFMITGFSGMFNQYDSAGGVSGGRLGGIRSIRPDFETDLKVKLVPYSYDTVYLKAFTGKSYTSKQWYGEEPLEGNWTNPEEEFANRESGLLEQNFQKGHRGARKTKLEITNVGANSQYPYLPYYALAREGESEIPGLSYTRDVIHGRSPLGQSYQITSYPYPEFEIDSYRDFDWYLNDVDYTISKWEYTNVPGGLETYLENFCEENGIEKNASQQEIIEQINSLFHSQYSYSMNPGATPGDWDFAAYFLDQQKKGFCVHFASAAVLLLRVNDIPARYVEGYAIPYSRILDSEIAEEEVYEEWFEGASSMGTTAVVEVEVTDAMAHAWVEVYEPEFGWLPIEFTPPSYEPMENNQSFWSFFSDVLTGGNGTEQENQMDVSFGENMMRAAQNVWGNIKLLLVVLTALLIGFLLFRLLLNRMRDYKKMHSTAYGDVIQYQYGKTILWFSYLYQRIRPHASHEKNQRELEGYLELEKEALREWTVIIERASYSPHAMTKEEAEYCMQMTQNLKRKGLRKTSFWVRAKAGLLVSFLTKSNKF